MCIHLMQPSWASHVEFCQDVPYYLVMFFTAVVYFGYTTVLMKTPHDVTWHLVFNVLHIAMHVNWQMTRRTDPGTIGLQDKGIYQSQYVQAIDEMCVHALAPPQAAVKIRCVFTKCHCCTCYYLLLGAYLSPSRCNFHRRCRTGRTVRPSCNCGTLVLSSSASAI